jgi:hypothetical protein
MVKKLRASFEVAKIDTGPPAGSPVAGLSSFGAHADQAAAGRPSIIFTKAYGARLQAHGRASCGPLVIGRRIPKVEINLQLNHELNSFMRNFLNQWSLPRLFWLCSFQRKKESFHARSRNAQSNERSRSRFRC